MHRCLSLSALGLLCSLLSCSEDNAQSTIPSIYIANFPDDKKGAMSFTFDDNCASTFSNIVPLFEQYGFKATFFVVPGTLKTPEAWAKWRDLSDKGFEIGNHSLSHPDLTKLDSVDLNTQVNRAYELIETNIGKAPVSFAPPHHRTNNHVHDAIKKKHLFSRALPIRNCTWQGWTSRTKFSDLKHQIDFSINNKTWYVGVAHGVGDGWEPINADLLEMALQYCYSVKGDLLVETFQNIALYKKEAENTVVSVSNEKGSKLVQVRSSLPEDIYNYPITLVIKDYSLSPNFRIYNVESGETVSYQQLSEERVIFHAKLNQTYEIHE